MTEPKFVQKAWPAGLPVTIAGVVAREVSGAGIYTSGQLECLRAEHDKLLDIVALMARFLPADAQAALATELYYEPEEKA